VITWGDFTIHEVFGPVLESVESFEKCRQGLNLLSEIQDETTRLLKAQGCALFQETGHEQLPARMVGSTSSDLRREGEDAQLGIRGLKRQRGKSSQR
jgi:hypothetical protein